MVISDMDINQTERKIAALLAELETSADVTVSQIGIQEFEIFNIDSSKELIRSVKININPKKESRWET